MFAFLKTDPAKKLQKQYEALLEKAMLAQRNGDIRSCSQFTYDAEQIKKQINSINPTN